MMEKKGEGVRDPGPSISRNALVRIIQVLLGSVTVVSIVARVLKVGLSGVVLETVLHFRQLAGYIFAGIPRLIFDLDIPPIVSDLWSLSFIGAGGLLWTRLQLEGEAGKRAGGNFGRAAFVIAIGLSMMGLIYFLLALVAAPYVASVRIYNFVSRSQFRLSGTTDAIYEGTALWVVPSVVGALLLILLDGK